VKLRGRLCEKGVGFVVFNINNRVCSTEADPDPDLSLEEQAVRWKLRQLDSNKNNVNSLIILQPVQR